MPLPIELDNEQEIESLKYRVIITSPECILNDQRFLELWKSKKFVNKLRSFVFDEAHCIAQWSGEFRPLYAELGRLRWLLPDAVFYVASATLPPHILNCIKETLHMRPDKTRVIRLSNDRPNIHLQVLAMLELVHSYYDILHVLRFDGDPPPPLFMVFCNDWKEMERLCQFARSQAPPHLTGKLLWFHSGMSQQFQTETIKKLHSHEIWGIFCTDAAGMVCKPLLSLSLRLNRLQGLDLRDIELVVQWKYTDSLCTLWQRLGRAARDSSTEATGVYIVEPSYTDHHHIEAKERAAL
jgi:superfamily II DNA helicase RecQ